jgi:threonine dehydrogenase-like Zn-dependent dehydrogenase
MRKVRIIPDFIHSETPQTKELWKYRPKLLPSIFHTANHIHINSELHVYRGHQPSGTDFIMGHEFTGHVVETGSSIATLATGDKIVSPFTLSCGNCFYCLNAFSSRCSHGLLFGSAGLDGAQAEYVRIPLADSTVVKAPAGVRDTALVLMADIWPTGFFAASNAFSTFSPAQIAASTVVVIGCGPVGLCALINAEEYKPKHLLAVDGVESRLELAKSLGAEPWNFQTQREGLDARVKELTEGRGADVVIEVVGLSPALKMGFELLRPWGVISSAGVHNGEVCLLVVFLVFCCAALVTHYCSGPPLISGL